MLFSCSRVNKSRYAAALFDLSGHRLDVQTDSTGNNYIYGDDKKDCLKKAKSYIDGNGD